MRLLSSLLLLALTSLCDAHGNEQSSHCVCLQDLDTGLRNPVALLSPPSKEDERLFLAEQVGKIHIYKDGQKTDDPFLDLSNLVFTSEVPGDERGFHSFTFHPDFKNNGYVFVTMSIEVGGKHYEQLSRYTVKDDDPYMVDPASEKSILRVLHESTRTIGGELFFGIDGYLYATVGDENSQAQNRTNVYGSILRIDIDVTESDVSYNIPSDNPFGSEIFAYGFRNPWRCGIDPGQPDNGASRGRILCGDVGASAAEEINFIMSGKNYGWDLKEGPDCVAEHQSDCEAIAGDESPVYYYSHEEDSIHAVIAGRFYQAKEKSLLGQFICGDIMGDLWSLKEETSGKWTVSPLQLCSTATCEEHGLNNNMSTFILSFGQDKEGDVYVLSTDNLKANTPGGKAQKFVVLSDVSSAVSVGDSGNILMAWLVAFYLFHLRLL